tara:strand:+ start:97 stop:582 length:486 start_codon:yes stop_codon:yes gene_type:complete
LYDSLQNKPILRALNKQSTTIIVTGPKSSGKTFTVHGQIRPKPSAPPNSFATYNFSSSTSPDLSKAGLVPRLSHDLFQAAKKQNLKHPIVAISMTCVYDEVVTDLLNPISTRTGSESSLPGTFESLPLFYSNTTRTTFPGQLTKHSAKSYSSLMEIYEQVS